MGCVASICSEEEEEKRIGGRIRFLEEEIRMMKCKREKEILAYEQHCMEMLFIKEMEWSHEREKYEEGMRKEAGGAVCSHCCVVQHMMRVEEARRDDAVEKWKQLYLAIKTELDDLILRTGQLGGSWCCRSEEEDLIQVLQKELKAREEMIEVLRVRLSTVERQGAQREREFDILRQSLRILNGTQQDVTDRKKKHAITCAHEEHPHHEAY